MSRGLGKLQRAILEAMHADPRPAGVFRYGDHRVAVARQLGQLRTGYVPFSGAFEAAFARAIRTLERRGFIRHVPYTALMERLVDVPDKR